MVSSPPPPSRKQSAMSIVTTLMKDGAIKNALVSILLYLMPFSVEMKLQISPLLWTLMTPQVMRWLRKKTRLAPEKREITIFSTHEGQENPMFVKFKRYIRKKFRDKIQSYELVLDSGRIDFAVKHNTEQEFEDSWGKHNITIKFKEDDERDDGSYRTKSFSTGENINCCVLTSGTATPEEIQDYVNDVVHAKVQEASEVTVYTITKHGGGKKDEPVSYNWKQNTTRTTKSQANTLYPKHITEGFFDDIEAFYKNEDWYIRKGVPYKRGYLFHGVPGTGKTSIAKIIAKKYKLPVFTVDLTIIATNDDLNKIMGDIPNYTQGGRYLLLFEDADRSEFFRYGSTSLTMNALLNVLDGVIENHGCVTIWTANDVSCFRKSYCRALMRPGRIDKEIEFTYCDIPQVREFYELFYDDPNAPKPNWDNLIVTPRLTPVVTTKIILENMSRPNIFLQAATNYTPPNLSDESHGDLSDDSSEECDLNQKRDLDDLKRYSEDIEHHATKRDKSVPKTKEERMLARLERDIRTRRRNLNYSVSNLNSLKKSASKIPKQEEKVAEKKKIYEYAVKKLADFKAKIKAKKKAKLAKEKAAMERDKFRTEKKLIAEKQAGFPGQTYDHASSETPDFLLHTIPMSAIPDGTRFSYLQKTNN